MLQKCKNAAASICINEILCDDALRLVLSKIKSDKEKDIFGLVCKRWLHLHSTERKKLCVSSGHNMLRKFAKRFTCLVELDLSMSTTRWCHCYVADTDVTVIASGFKCLRVLNLQNAIDITGDAMVSIGRGLPTLQTLDVWDCICLTDKGLSAVAEGCRDMRSLDLSGCKSVTDGVLRALSKNCHNLEELSLQGCTNITDSGLVHLVNGCKKINFLDINECSNVGEVGVFSVSKACLSSLKTLVIGSREDTPDECLKSLLLMGILLVLS